MSPGLALTRIQARISGKMPWSFRQRHDRALVHIHSMRPRAARRLVMLDLRQGHFWKCKARRPDQKNGRPVYLLKPKKRGEPRWTGPSQRRLPGAVDIAGRGRSGDAPIQGGSIRLAVAKNASPMFGRKFLPKVANQQAQCLRMPIWRR